MAQLLLYSFLLIGAFQLPISTLSNSQSQYEDGWTYLPGNPSNGVDPLSGEFLSYHDLTSGDITSRAKRQAQSVTNPPVQDDKSAFTKKPSSTKKPTTVIKTETANNIAISMTTSTAAAATVQSSGKTSKMEPTPTAITTTTITASSQPKINATATAISKLSPTPNTTLTPPDSTDEFPEFPPDYMDFTNNNYTMKNDSHRYYNSSYFRNGSFLWVDLDNHTDAETHELLSNAHRRAATVKLQFEFPFYGHMVTNVTMATGGFIYLGEQVHAWLAATQYVAPLMANFDSRDENSSSVRYLSNASQFTVEWTEVHLHRDSSSDSSPFTFQTTLYKNGTIVFAYKEIPIEVKGLNETHHPVKVGLSDAYITDKTILFVKSRTIFEYDRVDLKDYQILNGSGIIFTALPTCLSYTNCQECTTHMTKFNCVWCPKAGRCSDGTDRHRQDWIVKSCTFQHLDTRISCFIGTTSTESSDAYRNFGHDDLHDHDHDHDDNHILSPAEEQYNHDHQVNYSPEKVVHAAPPPSASGSGMSASGITGLLFFLILIVGVGGWIVYSYYNPHSTSGQLLIRFRPSQWGSFRRGEARYTAASIHM